MRKVLSFLLIILSFILVGCNFTFNPNKSPEDFGLSTVQNQKHLKQLLDKANSNYNFQPETDDALENEVPSDSDVLYQGSDYTKTNIQVEGVDEGDIIKTDGSKIYFINRDKLQVVKLIGEGKMELVFQETIASHTKDSSSYYSELYVTDKYLIVIGQKYSYNYAHIADEITDDVEIIEDAPYYYNYSNMSVVEVYDKDTFEKVTNYSISGYTLGSRLINNKIYLLTNYYVYYNIEKDKNFDLRPWYILNDEFMYVDYEEIKYLPDTAHNGFTIISTIHLDNNVTVDKNIFLSTNNWGIIYLSNSSIYLAYSFNEYITLFNYLNKGVIISYQIDEKTGNITYGGKCEYEGSILNQFSIDEYNGYLRLATTTGWGIGAVNRLYIFKRELKNGSYRLKQISLIDSGIGKPGERIESVRFNKDVATVVTFLRTDPFYTIDLTNPYKPKIVGELEIPGFSRYQHPWTDNLIVGIGFDANENGVTTGIKIALYDITDLENPIEVGKPLLFNNSSNGWSVSEAFYNHKAIMIDKSKNLIGMQLRRYHFNGYHSRLISDYIVLDIDDTREQPIQVKHSISHTKYIDENIDNNKYYYWYNDFGIKRAFRVDNYLYALSNEVITSHNLIGEMTTIDKIIYSKYQNNNK